MQTQTLTRVNQGTLTLLGSNPAAFGQGAGTQKFIVGGTAPATTPAGAGTILTTPSVFIRLAGASQDADFATYTAGTGFQTNTATQSSNNLTGAQATSLGVITAATAVGSGATNSILDLRTTANITSPPTAPRFCKSLAAV